MRAARLASSAISRVAFDEDAGVLSIWFRDSGLYLYFDVTQDIYEGLRSAPSAGRFFCDRIKGRYRCSQDPARRRFRPAGAA